VHGRLDRQVKIRGCRVEPAEIERTLRGLGMFRDVAVVPFEDPRAGTSLAACLVPTSDTLESERIRQALRNTLPHYMVPARFVRLAALPITSGGKLDLRALAALATARATVDDSYLAPRSSVEAAIAEEWRALLGVERVGARDNFFDLGGHSLLLAQLQVRLKRRFQRDIPMVELFRHPTVEHLADYFGGGGEDAAEPRLEHAIERAALRRGRRALEKSRD
jgi:acyl carrier protein